MKYALKITCILSGIVFCGTYAMKSKMVYALGQAVPIPGEKYGYLEEPSINDGVLIACNNYLVRCDNNPLGSKDIFYKVGFFKGMYEKWYEVITLLEVAYENEQKNLTMSLADTYLCENFYKRTSVHESVKPSTTVKYYETHLLTKDELYKFPG